MRTIISTRIRSVSKSVCKVRMLFFGFFLSSQKNDTKRQKNDFNMKIDDEKKKLIIKNKNNKGKRNIVLTGQIFIQMNRVKCLPVTTKRKKQMNFNRKFAMQSILK